MSPPGRFTILLGGALTPTPRLLAQVAGTRVIAADGGMAHARALGLEPELWVGDFDSTSPQTEADYRHIPRETHPIEKAMTDGEIAIEAAISRGATSLILAGGLGGQTDHALGHLALLLALAKRGIPAFATSGTEEAYPLSHGKLVLALPPGARLSIIAFSGLAGLDIAGVRWPLTNKSVPMGSTLTLSNTALNLASVAYSPVPSHMNPGSAATCPVEIGLASGTGIVVAYPAAA